MTIPVQIILFEDVELLDFAGPYEVFSASNIVSRESKLEVFTIAADTKPLKTCNGISVISDRFFGDFVPGGILVIPGGNGTKKLAADPHFLDQLKVWAEKSTWVLSVCTGARLLAKAGLLDGLTITTHHTALDELTDLCPQSNVVRDRRFCDNGKIITAAGVTAGIEASLHLLGRVLGKETADSVARYIEID